MRLLIYSLILIFSQSANALNQAIFQYAGEIGKYSFGVGDDFNKYYTYSFHYGYVPGNSIQNKIETYTFKNNLNLYRYNYKSFLYTLYGGLALYHVPGNKYKTQEISDAPDNYYRQSVLRGLAYLGHNFRYKESHSIYFESGINDIWLINSANNDSVKLEDHVSLGIGYNFKF